MTALLKRLPNDDFRTRYAIPSQPHLLVEGSYEEEAGRQARRYGWTVLDTRFTPVDKRRLVRFFTYLDDLRDWVREGCPESEVDA